MNKLADMDPLPLVSHISEKQRGNLKPAWQAAAASSKICTMEIYQYDPRFVKERLHSEADSLVVLLKVYSGGACGRAELQLSGGQNELDLVRFASVFRCLKGLSPTAGLEYACEHLTEWGQERKQLAEAALLDLTRKLAASESLSSPASYAEQCLLFDCSQAYYSF